MLSNDKITRNKLKSFLVLAKPNKNHERHLHNHQKNPFNDLSLEYMKKIALIIVYLNFSIMIEDRFIRVAVQIILTQRLAGRVINVLNISRLRVRRVDDRNRWSLFGIAVGTALYYRFAWRVAGNRW